MCIKRLWKGEQKEEQKEDTLVQQISLMPKGMK